MVRIQKFTFLPIFRPKFQILIKFALKKGYRTLRRVNLNKIAFICKKNLFICKKYKKGKRGTKYGNFGQNLKFCVFWHF